MTKNINKIILMLILATSYQAQANVGHFYQGKDRYRGFYWFEDKTLLKKESKEAFYVPTPLEAEKSIEARRKTLDDARNQMIELAFRKDTPPEILRAAIVKYKKLEQEMYDGAIRLSNSSDMANFTNPEIADQLELPTNVFANKIKRKVAEEEKIKTIREFAGKFDLVLFANDNCPYCTAFLPVASSFAEEYGFVFNTTGLNTPQGKIAVKLGITRVPTAYLVKMAITQGCPQCEGAMSDLEAIARDINGMTFNQCEQGKAIAEGLMGKFNAAKNQKCLTKSSIKKGGSDLHDATQKCQDNPDRYGETGDDKELKSMLPDNFNLVWHALSQGSGEAPSGMKEMIMSISGSIIGLKHDGVTTISTLPSLIEKDDLLEQYIGKPGEGTSKVKLYVCNENRTSAKGKLGLLNSRIK